MVTSRSSNFTARCYSETKASQTGGCYSIVRASDLAANRLRAHGRSDVGSFNV